MDAVQNQIRRISLVAFALFGAAAAYAQGPMFVFPDGTNVTLQGSGGAQIGVQSSGGPISYSIAVAYNAADNPSNANWLSVNFGRTSGITSGAGCTGGSSLCFALGSLAGLASGLHTATVTLTATDSSGATGTVNVTYDTTSTSGGGGTNGITANPSAVTVASTESQPTATIQLQTSNPSTLSFTVAVNPVVSWLGVSPVGGSVSAGNSATLTATFNPAGLANNVSYTTNIVVSYASTTVTIPVTYTVGTSGTSANGITVSPSPINLSAAVNGAAVQQVVTVTSSSASGTRRTGLRWRRASRHSRTWTRRSR